MKFFAIIIFGLFFLISEVPCFGQNQNLRLDQGKFNSFRRAKRIYYQGHMNFLNKKYEKANKNFKKCVEIFPEFSEAYFYMSKINYSKKKYGDALDNILMAEKYFMFMYNLQINARTELLRKLRVRKQAIKKLLQDPMSKLTDEDRTEMQNELLQIDDKLKTPVTIAGEDAKIPSDYYFQKGNVFLRLNKFKDAYLSYVKSIEVNEKNPHAYNNLLSLLISSKNGKMAVKYLEMAEKNSVKINPELKKRILAVTGKK